MAGTCHFFPTHLRMPSTTNAFDLQQEEEDIVQYLQNPHPGIPIDMNKRHTQMLQELVYIFKIVAHKVKQQK